MSIGLQCQCGSEWVKVNKSGSGLVRVLVRSDKSGPE